MVKKTETILGKLKSYFIKMRWFFLAFLVLGVLLTAFPGLDLYISGLFYSPEEGFFLSQQPALMFVYHAVNYVTGILIAIFVIIFLADIIMKKNLFGIRKRAILFLMFGLILAPGIVVNAILKENVGRPRPEFVVEFGGESKFMPPFIYSEECDSNCSFVSGHASLGFYFMAFGLLASGLLRRRLLLFGFLAGVLIGFVRIMQGRHFFSDIVFAFFFVWLTLTLLYEFMFNDNEA